MPAALVLHNHGWTDDVAQLGEFVSHSVPWQAGKLWTSTGCQLLRVFGRDKVRCDARSLERLVHTSTGLLQLTFPH